MSNAPSILAGRYHIGERVYGDANVSLYRGYDQLLNRAVGIEMLNVRGTSPDLEGSLQEKARRMVQTELPHVAALYDQGEQDGHSFLVIEELALTSLAEAAPLTPALTADLVTALATTLRAAAQKRVVPPRIDANTVRMTPEGLFQIVNWGAAPPVHTDDIALVTPLLALAVTGSEQGAEALKRPGRGAKRSPLERVVERATNGRYSTLDELIADVEAAKTAADDPTVVVSRGRPTVMVPVESTQSPPQQQQPHAVSIRRLLWLPILLVVLLLLAGAAVFGRSLFDRSEVVDAGETTTTVAQSTQTPRPTPGAPTEAAGQPFVVNTVGGQRLNVRSAPNQNASIVGKLNNGDNVRVLEGPVDGGGLRWARIQANDVQGWCVYDALDAQ